MFEKHSNGKMASNSKLATTKRDIQGSLIEKGNRLKTCLLKQNYNGFYQHNGHRAGVAQVCQPHFTSIVQSIIFLLTDIISSDSSFFRGSLVSRVPCFVGDCNYDCI